MSRASHQASLVRMDPAKVNVEQHEACNTMCPGGEILTHVAADDTDTSQAWFGLLLQLIYPTEIVTGDAACEWSDEGSAEQAVSFMIPPYQPLVQSVEVFVNLYFFAGLAWAWVG